MKRALLIASGTVGGLGAVLAVTPPQFTATQDVAFLSGALAVGPATQATPSARQPSVAAKPSQGSATTQQPAPAVTKSSVAPASSGGYSGTVTGASFSARNCSASLRLFLPIISKALVLIVILAKSSFIWGFIVPAANICSLT